MGGFTIRFSRIYRSSLGELGAFVFTKLLEIKTQIHFFKNNKKYVLLRLYTKFYRKDCLQIEGASLKLLSNLY